MIDLSAMLCSALLCSALNFEVGDLSKVLFFGVAQCDDSHEGGGSHGSLSLNSITTHKVSSTPEFVRYYTLASVGLV
jgi:hypothetical protein